MRKNSFKFRPRKKDLLYHSLWLTRNYIGITVIKSVYFLGLVLWPNVSTSSVWWWRKCWRGKVGCGSREFNESRFWVLSIPRSPYILKSIYTKALPLYFPLLSVHYWLSIIVYSQSSRRGTIFLLSEKNLRDMRRSTTCSCTQLQGGYIYMGRCLLKLCGIQSAQPFMIYKKIYMREQMSTESHQIKVDW